MSFLLRTRRATLCSALLGIAVLGANCQTDARFEPGADDNTFGTLIDDRGSFEFVRNPDDPDVIQQVNADNGTITPPTGGQDLVIGRDDGGSLEFEPTGENDVVIILRDDPTVENVEFTVSRDALGADLEQLVRPNGLADACTANTDFLDFVCERTRAVDLAQVVTDVRADLTARGEDPPDAETLTVVLLRYLILPVECCLAWDELRLELGIDPCSQ